MMRMNAVACSSPAVPEPGGPLLGGVLEVADRLALASGPGTVDDLALASGTDAPSLHRLLRVLACARVTGEPEPGSLPSAQLDPMARMLSPPGPDDPVPGLRGPAGQRAAVAPGLVHAPAEPPAGQHLLRDVNPSPWNRQPARRSPGSP